MSDEYVLESLEKLCRATGVGGQRQIMDAACALLKEYTDNIIDDATGNLIATISSNVNDAPVVLLEAHMDEIGFVVTDVDEKGFLKVSPCGGVDTRCLAATPVTVWADTPLTGVFCSTPPHLQKDDSDKALTADALRIDVGLSAEEAKKRINPGSRYLLLPISIA